MVGFITKTFLLSFSSDIFLLPTICHDNLVPVRLATNMIPMTVIDLAGTQLSNDQTKIASRSTVKTINEGVLSRVRIVKLLTQHVVRSDFWVLINGSPSCWWWGCQSENSIHDWFEMGCRFSPSLIYLGYWCKTGLFFTPYLHPKEEEG